MSTDTELASAMCQVIEGVHSVESARYWEEKVASEMHAHCLVKNQGQWYMSPRLSVSSLQGVNFTLLDKLDRQ